MRRFLRDWLCWLWALIFAAPIAAQSNPKLTETEARLRQNQVRSVSYEAFVSLSETKTHYEGRISINFDLTNNARPLRIDFANGEVKSVKTQNGKALAFTYDKEAIAIPKGILANGQQTIHVEYRALYSRSRSGLMRYKDPVDGRTYLYTDFEPYDANRLYPLFDQPDLRAPMTLTVEAPKEWHIISTTRETKVEKIGKGDRQLWHFAKTLPIATYLYSLHAGPYQVWEDKTFRHPLRLFARVSQASDVRFEEWFQFTRYGFDFFENLTGIPYPFFKYDQILVPDFGGAMENVAAVTFTESLINPGERTRSDVSRVLAIILHEMAHMWFGNLVTMSWWDNLWLNESFASYMQALAQSAHPEYKDLWERHHGSKLAAMRYDGLPVTHPIVQEVADTNSTNFDRITYNKGSAFLRVFHQKIGDENFKKGLNHYLKTYAYKNASIDEWVEAFEHASGQPLKAFVAGWIQTAGTNDLRVQSSCTNGKLEKLTIIQSAPAAHPTLREHSSFIDLYTIQGGLAKKYASLKAQIDKEQTVVKGSGEACPDLVFPNANDSDFANIIWTDKEKEFLLQHGEKLEEPFLKLNMLSTLMMDVELGRLSVSAYTDLILRVIAQEKNPNVYEFALNMVALLADSYVARLPNADYRKKWAAQVADVLKQEYQNSSRPTSDRLAVFSELVTMLRIAEDVNQLEGMWENAEPWSLGLGVNENRWQVLAALSALGSKKSQVWADAWKVKDPSNNAEKSWLLIKARAWPYAKRIETMQSIVRKKSKYRQTEINSIFSASFNPANRAETMKFVNTDLLRLAKEAKDQNSREIAYAYIGSLTQSLCEESDQQRYEKLLAMGWTTNLSDSLRSEQTYSERCVRLKL